MVVAVVEAHYDFGADVRGFVGSIHTQMMRRLKVVKRRLETR
jgi:hypothetical protein